MVHVGRVFIGGAKGSPYCGFIHHLHTLIIKEQPFVMAAHIADVMPCNGNMALWYISRIPQYGLSPPFSCITSSAAKVKSWSRQLATIMLAGAICLVHGGHSESTSLRCMLRYYRGGYVAPRSEQAMLSDLTECQDTCNTTRKYPCSDVTSDMQKR